MCVWGGGGGGGGEPDCITPTDLQPDVVLWSPLVQCQTKGPYGSWCQSGSGMGCPPNGAK